MVKTLVGDLFKSDAQTLVNTVNCVGVMGKGVAKQFRERFPDMYEDYVRRCERKEVRLGRPYVFKREPLPWILLFPTKDHWRSVSRLDAIVRGLEYLEQHAREWGITSLSVPPLGCGLGGLEWSVVGRTLFRHLERLNIPVDLFAPRGTPPEQLSLGFLTATSPEEEAGASNQNRDQKITVAVIALVEVLARLEQDPHHWPVGRVKFQKLAYFATQYGVPTGLRFERGSYGPYSAALKASISHLVNNGLITEESVGDMQRVRPGRTFEDARARYAAELSEFEPVIARLQDLLARVDTRTCELAATIDLVTRELATDTGQIPGEMAVLDGVRDWKQKRRPPFEDEDVALTIRSMAAQGWIDVVASNELPVPAEEIWA